MPLRVLIIDDATKAKVKEVVDYASNPMNYYRPNMKEPEKNVPPGDDSHYVVKLNDFRCVFTITKIPDGTYRHLSVSIRASKRPGALPHPVMFEELAHLFGFTGKLTDWMVRPEGGYAIVAAQKLPTISN